MRKEKTTYSISEVLKNEKRWIFCFKDLEGETESIDEALKKFTEMTEEMPNDVGTIELDQNEYFLDEEGEWQFESGTVLDRFSKK